MATKLILLSLVASCFAQRTIIDVLKARRETTLLGLIDAAGLTDTLKTGGPFTVFAPSNYAFTSLGSSTLATLKANPAQLSEVLQYHVVSGQNTRKDLMVNEKMLDSLAGPKIKVNYYLYNGHVSVEGARITTFDQMADNGVVHLISNVMTPPNGTIMDMISSDPNFSTLKAALEATGLDAALQDGPYTLLAPNNAAFQRLGDDLIQKLLANTELLKSILLYHVLHGTLYSTGMHSGSLTNLEETDRERIYASFSGRTVHIDSANVVQKDLSATNGVMHAIDHVLVPSSLVAQVKAL